MDGDSKVKSRNVNLAKEKPPMNCLIKLQAKSDKLMVDLEEKHMRLEERQMERDAQMRQEEREYHLQIMQMQPFSSFGPDYDPDYKPMHNSE